MFVVRGIRDSSHSMWVEQISKKAVNLYGDEKNVITPDYGFFSAFQFLMKPTRVKNIDKFRDAYTEVLAENPLTRFDYIGHSNGTYILGHSVDTTSTMTFDNVVLAAPVLPIEFNLNRIINETKQVKKLRYDTSVWDWPVGILSQMIRALNFHDVGPSGLVKFDGGDHFINNDTVQLVGWHDGGHGAALEDENLQHLVNFAYYGNDIKTGGNEHLLDENSWQFKVMRIFSSLTPYVLWGILFLGIYHIWKLWRQKRLTLLMIVKWAGIAFVFGIALSVV